MKLISEDALGIITMWMEARGEPHEGRVAVGEVIRNRMKKKYSSDGTVAGTVALRYQFSGWNDDYGNNQQLIASLKIDDADAIVQDCIAAWKESETSDLTGGALFYVNLSIVQPGWAKKCKAVTKIGNHTFFVPL
ncbi:MAG: hypothetical protein UY28_C0004G0026 [Candidatus Amesbacteria bacterium GW2011_GWB1_48_13]|uniref:Cell wall hydrolase SleB domain-containing protein n=1 Tax=Candidatus Amesbacteria bacterium GW2011_GWB1_48_13 TaxID=1618362 RepID=A0A0G1X6P4_9BACT|nr:MAG: hypothetical protein UY28_C0004G0026 [Candidatus Amesbacteria bacterium GW2011_GWB1_48_13]